MSTGQGRPTTRNHTRALHLAPRHRGPTHRNEPAVAHAQRHSHDPPDIPPASHNRLRDGQRLLYSPQADLTLGNSPRLRDGRLEAYSRRRSRPYRLGSGWATPPCSHPRHNGSVGYPPLSEICSANIGPPSPTPVATRAVALDTDFDLHLLHVRPPRW